MKHTETDLDKQSGEENVVEETLATVDIGTVTPEQLAELKERARRFVRRWGERAFLFEE